MNKYIGEEMGVEVKFLGTIESRRLKWYEYNFQIAPTRPELFETKF